MLGMGIVLIIAGIATLLGAVLVAKRASAVRWETADGVITLSHVQVNGEYIDPIVEFSYRVRERQFRSRTIRRPMISTNWRSRAELIVDQYPVGKSVTVHVNAGNPMDAMLELSSPSYTASVTMGIVAVVLVFAGILLIQRG